MIFILDSFSLLTLFLNQPGAEIVRAHLARAADGGYRHLLSGINYGEVFYTMIRRKGERAAEKIRTNIADLPIDIVMPSFELMVSASRLKAGGGLSYADCFAAALAHERSIPVLTGDPEFKRLEPLGIKVERLPPNR